MKQRGNIIILTVIMMAAILPLLGLAIGTGSIYINRSRMQNSANLAAMSGLQGFTSSENLKFSVAERAEIARKAVEAVVTKNKPLLSISWSPTVSLYSGDLNVKKPLLTFGHYEPIKPDYCTSTSTDIECTQCGDPAKYPCFLPFKAGADLASNAGKLKVNSAQVELTTKVNSFIAPFLSLLGSSTNNIEFTSSSISSVTPRCAVFLLDLSNSSLAESHTKMPLKYYETEPIGTNTYNMEIGNRPAKWFDVPDPKNAATPSHELPLKTLPLIYENSTDPTLYADSLSYNLYNLDPGKSDLATSLKDKQISLGNYAIPMLPNKSTYDCSSNSGLTERFLDGRLYWCGMKPARPTVCKSASVSCDWTVARPCCAAHYRDDYEVTDTPSGRLAIDKYNLPQPFDSFLEAANSSIRQIRATQTAQDKVAIIPFSGYQKFHGPVPLTGLTSDTPFLIDLTDIRRGRNTKNTTSLPSNTSLKSPNYLERDWFPLDVEDDGSTPNSKNGSDILGALHEAVNRLSNESYCPAQAQKTVLLATDGVMSDKRVITGSTVQWDQPKDIYTGLDWLEAEYALAYSPWPTNSLANTMKEKKIRLVMLLAGKNVDPNFWKVQKGPPMKVCGQFDRTCSYDDEAEFLAPWELPAQGIKGLMTSPEMSIRFSGVPPDGSYLNLPKYARSYSSCKARNEAACAAGGDCRPSDVNDCARLFSPVVPGFAFRAPNGAFGELAVQSNGIFCPLLEPYRNLITGEVNDACYDEKTGLRKPRSGASCRMSDCNLNDPTCKPSCGYNEKNCTASTGVTNVMSIIKGEKGQQAAFCANMAFGNPTFTLETLK